MNLEGIGLESVAVIFVCIPAVMLTSRDWVVKAFGVGAIAGLLWTSLSQLTTVYSLALAWVVAVAVGSFRRSPRHHA
jgi:hypothetical protein